MDMKIKFLQVHELFRQIKKASKLSKELLDARLQEIDYQCRGFFGFFKSLFGYIDYTNDEFTLKERQLVPIYLNSSLEHLSNMFKIAHVSILINYNCTFFLLITAKFFISISLLFPKNFHN